MKLRKLSHVTRLLFTASVALQRPAAYSVRSCPVLHGPLPDACATAVSLLLSGHLITSADERGHGKALLLCATLRRAMMKQAPAKAQPDFYFFFFPSCDADTRFTALLGCKM